MPIVRVSLEDALPELPGGVRDAVRDPGEGARALVGLTSTTMCRLYDHGAAGGPTVLWPSGIATLAGQAGATFVKNDVVVRYGTIQAAGRLSRSSERARGGDDHAAGGYLLCMSSRRSSTAPA
jgi:hypothetical protein